MQKQGLYDPIHEHDACGIGFVANINGGANGFNYLVSGNYYNSVGYQDR